MNKKVIWSLVLIAIFGLIGYYFSPESKLANGQKADKIVINKANHELFIFYLVYFFLQNTLDF